MIMPRTPLARLVAMRPRLMATQAAVVVMRHVIQKDATAAQWAAVVEAQADQILKLPPLTPDWMHDPVESANAPVSVPLETFKGESAPASALDVARLFLLRIQTLGIMWFAKGHNRYRDRARTELLAVCRFPNWTGDEFLVTAETMCGAALGYDWLFDHLTDDERHTVVDSIADKGLTPALRQFQTDATWVSRKTNWNLVCNGGLMIAALAIAEAKPRLTAELFRLGRRSVSTGFSMYRPDGGWIEGPGYWHYATQYAVYLVDSLMTALKTDLGLGRNRGFANTGLYRLHVGGTTGKLFNYADSEDHHSGGYWLFWLARRYNRPVDAWFEEKRNKVHPMDLLWFDPNVQRPRIGAPPTRKVFDEAGVTMLRHAWSKATGAYVGVKAGRNDSCVHAHYDLGSFVFESQGVRWAIDLGPDNYHLDKYFEPEGRLVYYRTNTLGHNTLVVNNSSQPSDAHAKTILRRFAPKTSLVVLDLTNAYPATRECVRAIALHDETLLIIDEIEPRIDCQTITWQMHTGGIPEVAGNRAHIRCASADGVLQNLYACIIEPVEAQFAVSDAKPSGPPGQNPNDGVSKLLIMFTNPIAPVRLVVAVSSDQVLQDVEIPVELAAPLGRWRTVKDMPSLIARGPA